MPDVIQRRSVPSLLEQHDGCEVDFGIDGIQSGERLPQERFLVVGDLQVAEGSLADAYEGDGIGEVRHDVVKVRGLESGGTSSDNIGHFERAGTMSPSGIGTPSGSTHGRPRIQARRGRRSLVLTHGRAPSWAARGAKGRGSRAG